MKGEIARVTGRYVVGGAALIASRRMSGHVAQLEVVAAAAAGLHLVAELDDVLGALVNDVPGDVGSRRAAGEAAELHARAFAHMLGGRDQQRVVADTRRHLDDQLELLDDARSDSTRVDARVLLADGVYGQRPLPRVLLADLEALVVAARRDVRETGRAAVVLDKGHLCT